MRKDGRKQHPRDSLTLTIPAKVLFCLPLENWCSVTVCVTGTHSLSDLMREAGS